MHLRQAALILTWLSASLVFTANGFGQSVLTNGLLAHYPLDGTVEDASGNELHGTIHGAAVATGDRFGNPNHAFRFDGHTSYITFPILSNVFGGDFSVSVWFSADDFINNWASLLYAENGSFSLGLPGDSCGCDAPRYLQSVALNEASTLAWRLVRRERSALVSDTHVVITKKGGKVVMYWNGQVAVTGQETGPTRLEGKTLFVGREVSENTTFHGVIDDIRIYDQALAESDVQKLYRLESNTPDLLPQMQTVLSGTDVVINSVGPLYPAPLQWTHNGTNLVGQTNTQLVIRNAEPSDSGSYRLVVSNSFTKVQSEPARLQVESTTHRSKSVELLGWNTDFIYENDLGSNIRIPSGQPFEGIFEVGYQNHQDGLPSSRKFTSAVSPEVEFEFAPYDTNNALFLFDYTLASRSASLILRAPERFSRLHILAGGLSGSAQCQMVLHFTDGTSSSELGFLARDWWGATNDFSKNVLRNPAISGLGRVDQSLHSEGGYSIGFEFQQSDISVSEWQDKLVERITFRRPGGPLVIVILGLSGERVRHPASAIVTVVNGFVVGIRVIDVGYGYTDPPVLKIVSETGTGAEGFATVEDGKVTAITVTNAGRGYLDTDSVVIASPPFSPWLDIAVSRVKVTQHVMLGAHYILEVSSDLKNWTLVGERFTPSDEILIQEFDVTESGQYFRIREVP